MKDKFAYYDYIANIIPGIICLWLLQLFEISILDAQNIVAESILYIVVAYVIGLVIQFFAKYIIEFIVKSIYWDNAFYSEICLLKGAKRIPEDLRNTIIVAAKIKFNISEDSIAALNHDFVFGFKGRLKWINKLYKDKITKAHQISNLIYRNIDAFTKDNNIAIKAHEQNNYYSLFRGLSMVFLGFLGVAITVSIVTKSIDTKSLYIIFGTLVGFVIFLIRTKERGELYIKGLYYSISSK
jgi:hypothetical protein